MDNVTWPKFSLAYRNIRSLVILLTRPCCNTIQCYGPRIALAVSLQVMWDFAMKALPHAHQPVLLDISYAVWSTVAAIASAAPEAFYECDRFCSRPASVSMFVCVSPLFCSRGNICYTICLSVCLSASLCFPLKVQCAGGNLRHFCMLLKTRAPSVSSRSIGSLLLS